MNRKSCGIDRLVSHHYITIFIHENEIRDRNLREVLRKRIQPEVIGQYRVPNRTFRNQHRSCHTIIFKRGNLHVPSNALIETSFCESINRFLSSSSEDYLINRKKRKTNTLKAAARCCFLYNLSSSKLSNLGYDLIFNFFPSFVLPKLKLFALPAASSATSVAAGAILSHFQSILLLCRRIL